MDCCVKTGAFIENDLNLLFKILNRNIPKNVSFVLTNAAEKAFQINRWIIFLIEVEAYPLVKNYFYD